MSDAELRRIVTERDALRRERDEAQRDARELRFLWELRGERANKAEDERDAAVALLRECRDALRYWTNHEYWSETDEDTIARIDAMLGDNKGV